ARAVTLFIPTKDFYEKKDVRGSYFHEFVLLNNKVLNSQTEKISEYELTEYLMKEFRFKGLKKENEYIKEILSSGLEKIDDETYRKKIFDKPPYSKGFFTDNGEFKFLTEDFEYNKKTFEVVTAKEAKALNSQFKRDKNVYVNPNSNFIMLNWLEQNIEKKRVVFSNKIPKNIIFAKGGDVINNFINCKGENAYYEIF
ncbi:MAG: molybdopterin oxidoreductase, partial [Nautiliaceae bacterium]